MTLLWSNSTLGDWLNKRTVVPDWPELEKLIRFLGGRRQEWQPRWRHAMSAYQAKPRGRTPTLARTSPEESPQPANATPDADERQPPDGLGGPALKRPQRRRLLIAAILLIVALLAVVSLVQRAGTKEKKANQVWQATVVNTWSSSRQKDIGIRPWRHPDEADQPYPGYFTNDVVSVVCYYTAGRLVEDKTTHETSTVWYQLNDGLWLPALFLQLDGSLGTIPPARMRVCQP